MEQETFEVEQNVIHRKLESDLDKINGCDEVKPTLDVKDMKKEAVEKYDVMNELNTEGLKFSKMHDKKLSAGRDGIKPHECPTCSATFGKKNKIKKTYFCCS